MRRIRVAIIGIASIDTTVNKRAVPLCYHRRSL